MRIGPTAARWLMLPLQLLAACASQGGGELSQLSCDELSATYREAVKAARRCDPLVVAADQCSTPVDTKLDCGCPLLVNPSNTEAMTRIEQARQAWTARDCSAGACPSVAPCAAARHGRCAVATQDLVAPGQCENDTSG